jgi:uncharacterized protein (TIGR00369 family)
MDDSHRRRTITWSDPMLATQSLQEMNGLDYMNAVKDRKIRPPILDLIGFEAIEVEAGHVVFELVPGEYHYNPFSTVHAGITSTLLDSAMACAVHSILQKGVLYTTLEIKVNLIRPITRETGMLRCEGSVIHGGSRIATAEAKMTGTDGKLYAHAISTCMILKQTREA